MSKFLNKKLGIDIPDFPVIGIGSSAGGLNALEAFFDHCPSDTDHAFVVVQHLSPDYKSLMPELLSRRTQMVVKETVNGEQVKPNHVYLIPRNKNIVIENGCLKLTNRSPKNQINFSIDMFFKSLAIEMKDKAICCILSGTGTDGTKGAKSIKEVGGTVYVQKPNEAKFDGMPNSAIAQEVADFVLPVQDIVGKLSVFIKKDESCIPDLEDSLKNEEVLKDILNLVHYGTGFNFLNYKRPTLFRSTVKRINILKKKSFDAYLEYLKDNTEEKFLLAKEFLIGVTRFFRDTKAFEILRKQVLPNIVNAKNKGLIPIKIWVVACSTGEEAYSVAILLEEHFREHQNKCNYKIFATDINEEAIEIASKGIYQSNVTASIPLEYLNRYFVETENGYQITQMIRNNIIFSKHDILQNPPFGKMDFISCRNMLIYLEQEMQIKALSRIHFALNQYGYLFLGSSETASYIDQYLEVINSKWKIYKNLAANKILHQNFEHVLGKKNARSYSKKPENLKERTNRSIHKSINTMLVEEMELVFVCVDENLEIIHASGKLKNFAQIPEEGFSNSLIKILPDAFAIPIHTLIRKLRTEGIKKAERIVRWFKENEIKEVRLVTKEVEQRESLSHKKMYLIFFQILNDLKISESSQQEPRLAFEDLSRIEELQETLVETRENLQSTIEELETTNEEMQATNEEMIASNEELQSTNEELQSLNEELHTVNAELQEKNTQLLISNSDIENLIKNVNVGTIFLDKDFNIRKFTPAIKQHFHLRKEDLYRPINHFSGTLGGNDLMKLSSEVIESLQSHTQEVQNEQGVWFLMQIFPYRNQEDKIMGVVINFINIHDTKVALKDTAQANEFLNHLIHANPGIIYIYDLEKKENLYASDNIAKIAGYTDDEIKKLGSQLMEKLFYKEDLDAIGKHHEKMRLLDDNEILQIEYRIVHKTSKKPIWLFSTDKVNKRNKKGDVVSILGVAQEIHQLKELQHQLSVSESRLQLAIKSNKAALWEWSNFTTDKAWWSKEFYQLLGYNNKSLRSSFSSFINIIHPDDIINFRKSLEEQVREMEGIDEDIRIKTQEDGYRWYRVNARAQKEINGEIKKIVGTLTDIHNKKQSENKMKALNIELERFAYLASHDLKEPLRTVTSFTKLFKEEYGVNLDENAHTYLDFIEKASSRMITLTNDLLQYSQLDDKSLSFETVDLNLIVKEILEDLQKHIEDNKAEITFDELPHITCDAVQIRQLFQNLISNSLKYRKPDIAPVIWIGFEQKRRDYQFFVKDNGIGIKKEYHEKIFEVFKRLHSQEEYEGTGIGLANCKRIVNNHEGKMWIKSAQNKGATFYFSIAKLIPKKSYEKDQLHTVGR